MPYSINHLYSQIFKIWRRKRFELFKRVLNPTLDEVLLDVGGYPATWTASEPCVSRVDSMNVHPVQFDATRHPKHRIRTLVGDGCALEFPDRSYDIGFSNSVIEHVGTWERQQAFAAEIRRVAKRLWVQTPAYECPIEPHYLAPFVHWLPRRTRAFVIRWFTPRGWLDRPSEQDLQEMVATTRLLRHREVQELFPDCRIIVERLLGIFPKSYIAVRVDPANAPRDTAPKASCSD